MSLSMSSIPLGHAVDFKGPIGKFTYLGSGTYSINSSPPRTISHFAMICAGSGITPIFQVFRAIMSDPLDPTTCTLLNGNRLVDDILCRSAIDALLEGNERRAKVIYTLTQAPEKWDGARGRIDAQLVRKHCERRDGTMVLVCGPEALEKSMLVALKEQGWANEQILFF